MEKEEVKQEDQEDDNNNLEDGQEVYEEDKDCPDLQGLTAPVNWFMAQRFAEASVSDCKYLLSNNTPSLQQHTNRLQPQVTAGLFTKDMNGQYGQGLCPQL